MKKILLVLFIFIFALSAKSLGHEALGVHLHNIETALEKNTTQGELYIEQGRSLMEIKKYDQATNSFKKALTIDAEEYYQAHYYLAETLLLTNDFTAAENTAQKYIQVTSTFNKTTRSNSYLLLGDIYLKQEKFRQAVNAYQIAFNLEIPRSPDAYLRFSAGLEKINEKKRAVKLLSEGIETLKSPAVLTQKLTKIQSTIKPD